MQATTQIKTGLYLAWQLALTPLKNPKLSGGLVLLILPWLVALVVFTQRPLYAIVRKIFMGPWTLVQTYYWPELIATSVLALLVFVPATRQVFHILDGNTFSWAEWHKSFTLSLQLISRILLVWFIWAILYYTLQGTFL